jgi:hypothetical protein
MMVRARQRVEGELSFESRVRKVEGIYRELRTIDLEGIPA